MRHGLLPRFALIAGAAAAAISAALAANVPHPLAGTTWRLVKVQTVAVDPGGTLTFETDRVVGHSGCNAFWAPLAFGHGTAVDIGPPQSARIYCQGRMAIERAYFASLETITSFEITGNTLALKLDDGDVFLELQK